MLSSPVAHVDGPYLASEVALSRVSEPNRSCLLVEGQDDQAVYKRFVNQRKCQIIVCQGRCNLLSAIEVLNRHPSTDGYLAIKDADFDAIEGTALPTNLLITDGHDLEVMICSSEALDRLIEVHLRGTESRVLETIQEEIRAKLFQIGAKLGYIRWLSFKHSWSLNIVTQQLTRFITDDVDLSLDDCIAELKRICPHADVAKCSEEELASLQALHLCDGHELVVVLAVVIPKVTVKHLGKRITPGGEMAARLYLAYEYGMFQSTMLYLELQSWEVKNAPFKVLL